MGGYIYFLLRFLSAAVTIVTASLFQDLDGITLSGS